MNGSDKIAGVGAEDANSAPPGTHHSCTDDEGDVFPSVSKPPSGASAVPAVETDSPDGTTSSATHLVAPSPDTVVMAISNRRSRFEVEMRAREAALHEKYAAEIAELNERLLSAKKAHAAAVERLHTEYAAEVRRLVEALWLAQDAARAAQKRFERAAERVPKGLLPSSECGSANAHDLSPNPSKSAENAHRLAQIFDRLQPALRLWPVLLWSWRRARGNSVPPSL